MTVVDEEHTELRSATPAEQRAWLAGMIEASDPFQELGIPCWKETSRPMIPWAPDELDADTVFADND